MTGAAATSVPLTSAYEPAVLNFKEIPVLSSQFQVPLILLPPFTARSAPNRMIFGPLTGKHALVLQRRLSTSQRSWGAPVHRIPKPEGEDFRPPWVYLMSRLVSLTVIPGTFVSCFYLKPPYELYSGRVLLRIFLRLWGSRACFSTGVCHRRQFSI